MEQILCVYCGDLFDASSRHKNQTACKKAECQKHKMKIDPIYNACQKISQKQWARANPGYWKKYREKDPEKAERNRILQAIRNRKARSSDSEYYSPGTFLSPFILFFRPKKKSPKEGIPYQTLIGSVLHKYASGFLKEAG